MLLLLLAIAAAPPVAVDVTGMEPQLEIIRRDAAERGWQISCEGQAGEEQVLRLTFPAGTAEESLRSYFDPEHQIGSSYQFYDRDDALPERCDHEPPTISATGPWRLLAFGRRELLNRLVGIARACGFAAALVRARQDGDVPTGVTEPPDDWLALDAGEDVGPRYGPSLCFLQMQGRTLSTTDQQPR